MVVARADARAAHHVAEELNAAGEAGAEHHEAHLLHLVLPSLHQVEHAAARGGEHALDGPVVVLAVAVDALEGLLVEEHVQAVEIGELLHELHAEHVLVHRHVGHGEDGGKLVLAGRNLVVVGGHGDAEEEELLLHSLEVVRHRGGDLTEIVGVGLLAARRGRANDRAVGGHEIGAAEVRVLGDDEELLLPAHEGANLGHLVA
mmetsp:Transcript_4980/g.12376  ORF Transcript_4980/g.12376 Transcript_4980/m.12376 type:complete len:203 (-) Transcript_4980:737-1345(-)